METITFNKFVSFAEEATNLLDIFPEFKNSNEVNQNVKEDRTPVTDLDLNIEIFIRKLIKERFPTHSIHGEEFSDTNGLSPYNWIIDPIDGTFSYVKNVPLFGILLGLRYEDTPLFGSVRFPLYFNKLVVGDGKMSLDDGTSLVRSFSTSFNESLVLTSDERSISNSIYKDKWDELCNLTRYHRTWGDCFGYFLVCTGKAQVMFDINLKPCDILPLIPIILGSGCKIIELRSPYKDIIVCTPEIYDEVIKVF